MKLNINIHNHEGYSGDNPDTVLRNGESGLGYNDNGKMILVTSCGNCGDYHWLDVEDLAKQVKRMKTIKRRGAK